MIVLIMGLPGSGKTTLAKSLCMDIGAVHWDGDDVRSNINEHLGFSESDRIKQAKTMGWLSRSVSYAGKISVASFVCPTPDTIRAFGRYDVLVWMDTIKKGRFENTNRLFVPPENPDIVIDYFNIGKDDINETISLAVRQVGDFLSESLRSSCL